MRYRLRFQKWTKGLHNANWTIHKIDFDATDDDEAKGTATLMWRRQAQQHTLSAMNDGSLLKIVDWEPPK